MSKLFRLHNLFALFLLIVLFALPFAVQAQESSTEAPPASTEAPTDETWLAEISFAAALVLSLTSLLKLVPIEAIRKIPSKQVAIVLNVLIFAAYKFYLEWNGDASQFQAFITNAGQVGDSALKILITFWSADEGYNLAKYLNIPILGAAKPLPAPPQKDL